MPTLTSAEFEFLIKDCAKYAGFNDLWIKTSWEHRGAVLISKDIMSELWLKQLPETPNTLELRRQIRFLHTEGIWDVNEKT